jgi:hypothetical protein
VTGIIAGMATHGFQQALGIHGYGATTDPELARNLERDGYAFAAANALSANFSAGQRNQLRTAIGGRADHTKGNLTINELRRQKRAAGATVQTAVAIDVDVDDRKPAAVPPSELVADISSHHRFYRNHLSKTPIAPAALPNLHCDIACGIPITPFASHDENKVDARKEKVRKLLGLEIFALSKENEIFALSKENGLDNVESKRKIKKARAAHKQLKDGACDSDILDSFSMELCTQDTMQFVISLQDDE